VGVLGGEQSRVVDRVVVLFLVWVPWVLVCGGGACTWWLVLESLVWCLVWWMVCVGMGVCVCDSGGVCGLVCVLLLFLLLFVSGFVPGCGCLCSGGLCGMMVERWLFVCVWFLVFFCVLFVIGLGKLLLGVGVFGEDKVGCNPHL